ncbi:MAG: S9 family peptidase [Bacteroidota bacterium]|nr:S9 family peptidase [Candidatus Kapabacteria bacterium]MDW8220758.1 S9 family peptidase [Bacteroidota bacterium]
MSALHRFCTAYLNCTLLLLSYAFLYAQPPLQRSSDRITIEGIYTGQYRHIAAQPFTQWLANGSLVLFDIRKPAHERAYELLNPESGKRSPMFDMSKARASFQALRGTDIIPLLNFNKQGTFAFVEDDSVLLVLSVQTAEFILIAHGIKEETTRFSPDGQKLAYVKSNDIYVYDLLQQAETRITTSGSTTLLNGTHSWVYWEEVFDREDRGYVWSPDSRALAYYQTDESMVSQIIFPDVQPAVPANITQRYPKAGGTNPTVRVGIVELDRPQHTTWLDVTAGITPQTEYLIRIQWLPNSAYLAVQTMPRDQRELHIFLAERRTGKLTHLHTERDSAWVNLHDDLYFFRDGKRFLLASERTGYNHLYLYTFDGKGTARLLNAVTRGSWSVGEARGHAIHAVDESKELVYFKANEQSSMERHLYVIKLDGSGMKRLSQEAGAHSIEFNDAATYYTDSYSNVTTPPALRLHSADGRRIQELAPANTHAAASYNLRYPRLFTVQVDADFRMPMQILTPHNFDSTQRYPVIIYVYGGPSAPNVVNMWQSDVYYSQVLAHAGFVVVKMDNRSAAAISKRFENTCARYLAGSSELQDILAGVQWLKQQRYVDSTRIGIWGWSFGGAMTLQAMTHSRAFKAGIAVAAPTDWRFYDTKYTEAYMKTPYDNPDGYNTTNVNALAHQLHGRLFLVHGTYDDNVHPQNVWNFINALIRAQKHFDLMIYPMRKHGISDPPARIHLYNAMVEFWKKNL